jgi:hypothetical protein
VVADALSHKGQCNYLLAVHSTGEESNTRVLPDLSLFNITLTPTLRGVIIATEKNDAGMAHIKKRIQEGDPKVVCFVRMWRVPCGSRIDWLCRGKKH